MSRCFPFPPPGYEKKEKIELTDLIPKVKHQEKKIKKEKKDRDKREGKDKKDKDRSKDKKERKEKHKDKRKEKDRDKDKSSRVAVTDKQNHIHHDDKLVDRRTNHFKLTEELVNRIKDDEKFAASRMVEKTNGSVKRSNPGLAAAITGNNVHSSSDYSDKGIDEMARRAKFSCSTKKVEGIGSTKLPHNERSSGECAQKRNITGQTGTTDTGLHVEKSMDVGKKMEVPNSSVADGTKKNKANQNSSNSSFKMQKTINGMHTPTKDLPSMVHQDVSVIHHAAKMADGEINKHPHIIAEDRRLNEKDSKLGNTTDKWIQENDKGNDKEQGADNGKSEGKNSKEHKHKKKKDKNKHKEKKKERAQKGEKRDTNHKKQDSKDDAKGNRVDSVSVNLSNLQTDSGKQNSTQENISKRKEFETNGLSHENYGWSNKLPRTISSHIVENGTTLQLENSVLPCPTTKAEALNGITEVKIIVDKKVQLKNGTTQSVDSKKRKEFETNGLLHENYGRPNKLPRTSSSSRIVENGGTLQLANSSLPCPSMMAEALNGITEVKILVDKKGHMKNGITQVVDSKHPVVLDTKAAKVTVKSCHPDTKYLTEIYSVPKMNEWPECDEQEWLFNKRQYMRGPNMKAKVGKTPEVWSEALRIESDDVVVLPYVVPF